MPGDRFSLAVRVRCEVDPVRLAGFLPEVREKFSLAADRYIFWLISMIDINSHSALGEISDVTVTGRHLIIGSEKFLDRLYFGRRLYNDQIVLALSCCCHFYLLLILKFYLSLFFRNFDEIYKQYRMKQTNFG